jgi:hypothetical protein
LKAILAADKHADAHGEYRVRSLYFDDPFDTALKDKTAGVERREKYRLRCYNGNFTVIRLEKKIKRGGMCVKLGANLSREETARLLNGQLDFMLQRGDDLLTEFYSKMRGRLLQPKTIVEYIREAYTHAAGNTRVTLDREVRTGLCSTDFFREGPLYCPTDSEYVVLEIKYDAFLPEVAAKAIRFGNVQSTACSKYAVSRRYD